MLDFPQKLPILDLTKTLRVWSGFTVGFGFLPGFSSKVGFGFRSGKNSRGRVFVGFGLDPLHHYQERLIHFVVAFEFVLPCEEFFKVS